MRHIFLRTLPTPVVAAMLPLLLLVACEAGPSEPELTTSDVPNVRLSDGSDQGAKTDHSNVMTFAGMKVGDSWLTRTANGISLHLQTDRGFLEQGEAMTIWAVVFNKPDECAGSPCGLADLFDPDVMGDVVRIAGGIVGGNGLEVSGSLREGDSSGSLFPQPSPGLMDAMTAELHFIVRTHGDLIPGEVHEQIMSVDGGCDTNDCEDAAFSVHK